LEQAISKLEAYVNSTMADDVRRLDGEQRRRRVMAAAIQECSVVGFRAASVARIAQRAKVSTASLYRDFQTREKLLEETVAFAAPMVGADLVKTVEETQPRERLIALLLRHCAIFRHPHASWLYRAHASGELANGRGMDAFAFEARRQIETLWQGELEAVAAKGLLPVSNVSEAINFLLGAMQRRTLLAMLLFGDDDVAEPNLEVAATCAVDWLLKLESVPPKNTTKMSRPVSKSPVSKSYIQQRIEADLAGDEIIVVSDRRHQRILAAAVQECSQRGFRAASMAGVARRASVSTATLYRFYKDKTELFLECVAYLVPLMSETLTASVDIEDPYERIVAMLIRHGEIFGDPFMTWLYRMYVSTDVSGHFVNLNLVARAGRAMTEVFWSSELKKLEAEGHLAPSDHAATINCLLGPIERQTIITQLLFGMERIGSDRVEAAARFSAHALFQAHGIMKT
jgi:AcrR family transcriptional regulator